MSQLLFIIILSIKIKFSSNQENYNNKEIAAVEISAAVK